MFSLPCHGSLPFLLPSSPCSLLLSHPVSARGSLTVYFPSLHMCFWAGTCGLTCNLPFRRQCLKSSPLPLDEVSFFLGWDCWLAPSFGVTFWEVTSATSITVWCSLCTTCGWRSVASVCGALRWKFTNENSSPQVWVRLDRTKIYGIDLLSYFVFLNLLGPSVFLSLPRSLCEGDL